MVDQLTLQTIGILLTGLTVSIAAIYYTLTLRYTRRNQDLQLETRQAQLFQHVYDNWMSPELSDDWRMIRPFEFKDYDHFFTFWETYTDGTPEHRAMGNLIGYYEGIGVYVKEGLINIRLVALLMTGMTTIFYRKFLPYAERYRKETGYDWFVIETEYLYNELMRYIDENPDYRTSQHP
jgi:hypothetical protein